jgi:CubicO group peptidase (beta-lactamase class C family)
VPEFKGPDTVTLRSLLGHRSGIRDPGRRFYGPLWRGRTIHPLDWLQGIRITRNRGWSYSNAGFVLAGLAMKRAAGAHWDQLRHAMTRDLYLQPDDRPPAGGADNYVTRRHRRYGDRSGYLPSRAFAISAWTAGAWAGTPEKVAQFANRLFEGRVLQSGSLGEMTRFRPGGFEEYGLGLERQRAGSFEVWSHSGDAPGVRTELTHVPDLDMTLFTVWNTDELQDPLIHRALLILALDKVRKGR